MDKKELRSSIFRHLDGIVTAPVVAALQKKEIIDQILRSGKITLKEFSEKMESNEGYLNVALRVLASQGFVDYHLNNNDESVTVSANANTGFLLSFAKMYEEVIPFQKESMTFNFQQLEPESFNNLVQLFDEFMNHFGLEISEDENEQKVQQQILKHIEGCLVGPIIVQLGMNGMFHKYFMETSFQAVEFHKNPENFEKVLDFLTHLGWFTKTNQNYKFTENGLYFARRATAYGVTVSYLPMFNRMEDLLFGDPKKLRETAEGEDEIHVDRKMNVWGSGGAHSTYFKVVTDFIVSIFNQPIHLQPKGILDMGCGNGAFIQHIFETIERQTLRGRMLEDYPLFLVGADYNQAALNVTRANLINNDIWAKVIWGDIGNPDLLANDLKENYDINLSDLVNIRTFLDHNRIWKDTKNMNPDRISTSSGAFAFRGARIPNKLVEENLKEHLNLWLPYIKKNGLLVIELHTLQPELTSKHLGETAATAYDATHGFSDQYIVEVDVFHKICNEVGLTVDKDLFKKYPDSDLATVSINLLKA
ncbi:class I SAM-dependent methyltransferase [Chryseobacterium sp.]|uniref:class I SAM-dependent methyltransferase n=1 Tax=Chryseobacterium sp. TaxID=1871047 RepID=UPI0011CABF51|nr:class I SAM-dependent methyltransferase [Chryseobacterium sp.]TXF76368.1 class I SAM-dependent methyltransferase [Chryseobacterium sp.]